MCDVDLSATADGATNYPAFNYVNTYASTFELTGEYANGWYMPTLAELCGIYRNNDTLNAVLDALGLTHLHSSYYWSSSQSANKNYDAWAVDFSSGTVSYRDKVYNGKYNDFYVCCVRAFN
ncbi:MAG: DUF1566 domain-containing protein [Treponema sp.]|nr:DUF1566 domain-containing protein [Treponema sp.]